MLFVIECQIMTSFELIILLVQRVKLVLVSGEGAIV